jgi:PHP family Zn ribbon phosphoesterase
MTKCHFCFRDVLLAYAIEMQPPFNDMRITCCVRCILTALLSQKDSVSLEAKCETCGR